MYFLYFNCEIDIVRVNVKKMNIMKETPKEHVFLKYINWGLLIGIPRVCTRVILVYNPRVIPGVLYTLGYTEQPAPKLP